MFDIDYTKKIVDFSNFDPSQLSDALLFGLTIVFIGMATVFAVLTILWISLMLFKLFFHDIPKKRKCKKATVISENDQVTNEVKEDPDVIIAVIAAAIAMAESECNDVKFKVVSFRRI